MTVIDTPEGIAWLQFCTRLQALKLELHGMKRHGRSMYVICKDAYGLKGTRASVLLQMENYKKQVQGNA
jgi:hypothetical protein